MKTGDDGLHAYMARMGTNAKAVAQEMAVLETSRKRAVLREAARVILERKEEILSAGASDVAAAKKRGCTDAFIDRMSLDHDRIDGICGALHDIADLDDPVGSVIRRWKRPNGLEIERVRVPVGLIAVIYESRPNVTVDAAAIAIMAGNRIILRGGSECIATSKALHECFVSGLVKHDVPAHAVQFVETADRAAVDCLLSGLDGSVDLVVPRGGKSLVSRVQSHARVPVLSHLDGICHVYVDVDADPDKAVEITLNSKMRRPGICGAAETLLVHQDCFKTLWPRLSRELRASGCELRGDAAVCSFDPDTVPATEDDFHTEYLAPVLSVAVVEDVDAAIGHIARYSSGHTEAVVTADAQTADRFLRGVDSAIVMLNASTQFADGGEFGLGAEIGIATGRLHARGPVGVEELTTYKNIVRGNGQVRP